MKDISSLSYKSKVTNMIAPSVLVQENNLAVTALSYGYHEEAFRIMREATTKLNRMPPPAENYFCQQRRWS